MAKRGTNKIKASWDTDALHTFCDICIEEINKGNKPGMCLSKKGWSNVMSRFSKETGREYERLQLKSKWNMLKKDWKIWNLLLENETDVKWNSMRGTIQASKQWWEEKIKVFPEAKRFRNHGIEPELQQKLDKMFTFVCNLDEYAPVPSDADELEYSDERRRPRKRKSSDSSFWEDKSERIMESVVDSVPNKSNVRTNPVDETSSPKSSAKMEAVANPNPVSVNQSLANPIPCEPIMRTDPTEKTSSPNDSSKVDAVVDPKPRPTNRSDHLADEFESRSRSAASIKCDHTCLITDAVRLLDSIDDVPKASPLYYFAIKLILDKDKREVFMALSPETKVWWLKMEEQESRK